MRQVLVQVPRGHGQEALDIARDHNGANLACIEATGSDGPIDLLFIHISNSKVGNLIDALQQLPDLHLTLIPRGVMSLQPPASHAASQVTDVTVRSPIEIFLAGLQSVGSWTGFLGYAVATGAVVWIGLYTDTTYLLTASMLIAPFAGPAMNTAIATARGDWSLLRRTLLRYVSALLVTILVTAALSFILNQQIATSQMVQTSELSSVTVLLPLIAGAAGALNLVQSQRSSLVPGAAIGILVAASLAPPAGLIGMASVIGDWDMAKSGFFVLLLQLVGINISGTIVFRLYGLSAHGPRFNAGKNWVTGAAWSLSILALVGLMTWQLWSQPEFQRSSRSQRAAAVIQEIVNSSHVAKLVETNVRFTRSNIQGQNTLLGVVYVQPSSATSLSPAEIRTQLTTSIQNRLLAQGFNVTPLIDVSVLEPPSGQR